ncbi:MAG: TRAP transporter small permease [Neomegalonema sp.]|nr:TRAP transporter small permease [Neomegalonema sp.]
MRYLGWIRHVFEAITALMLAVIFATFLIQIYSRYVMNEPFGWTLTVCLLVWIWQVFFGNAFIVRQRDHVSFDILYQASPRWLRRIFALISAAAISFALLWSLPATWDWIDFLSIKPMPTLGFPTSWAYSIYALFLIIVALRYVWAFFEALIIGPPDDVITEIQKESDAAQTGEPAK